MDLAITHIKETTIMLKHQRDEMEERLKSDSPELYDGFSIHSMRICVQYF
jgi:hypothetical protein